MLASKNDENKVLHAPRKLKKGKIADVDGIVWKNIKV